MSIYSSLYGTLKLVSHGGRESRRLLEDLRRTQWLSAEELSDLRLERVRSLVRHAYEHVPFYRDLYGRQDISPGDIRTWDDFQALPTIGRQDVMEHLEDLVDPRRRPELQAIMTGASTGEPMRFYVDDSFWWWNVAYENRGRGWHGVREGDRMAWIWGAPRDLHRGGWRARAKATVMRHRYLDAFSLDEASMADFAEMLQRWRPTIIRAYASMLDIFAPQAAGSDMNMRAPRLIEATAEKLRPDQQAFIESVFHCPVTDVYTAREFATIAYGCESGRSHVNETIHLELLDLGQPVAPGRLGDVVITSTHQSAMPFIRYRLGDEALLAAEPCPCGRGLPVLQEVVGRSNDYIVTPEGRHVHDGFFAIYFWDKPQVARYQVHQADIGRLQVRMVCVEPVDRAWLSTIDQELQRHLGPGIKIEPEVVDAIPRTSAGKHRFVISDVVAPSGRSRDA